VYASTGGRGRYTGLMGEWDVQKHREITTWIRPRYRIENTNLPDHDYGYQAVAPSRAHAWRCARRRSYYEECPREPPEADALVGTHSRAAGAIELLENEHSALAANLHCTSSRFDYGPHIVAYISRVPWYSFWSTALHLFKENPVLLQGS
jgi:hypothetical protein